MAGADRRRTFDQFRGVIGQVGGFASFVQWDPRPKPGEKRSGQYPVVGEPGWPAPGSGETSG